MQAALGDEGGETTSGPSASGRGAAPARRPGPGILRLSPGLVTTLFFVLAVVAALVVVALARRPSSLPEDSFPGEIVVIDPPPAVRRAEADAEVEGMVRASSPHAVPRPVPVDPRTARLRAALARVGFSEEEVLVSELLRRHVERAVRALRARDYREFDEAMLPVELATRDRECPSLLRLKRSFVIGGIRTLGPQLGQWDRFRIERMLADADAIPGDCRTRSALLRPLVLEVRDRLAQASPRPE